jgi:5-methylcytosine-specific restriction protein B
MFNEEKLKAIIENYKKQFSAVHLDEIYKWKAVKCFQNNWDLNAPDFLEMLRRSFAKTGNLLAANQYFPLDMLIFFAERDPEMVREMFVNLYDENSIVSQRIGAFIDSSAYLLEKYKRPSINTNYQDAHTISVYLTMKYPDKYYIYKYGIFRDFAANAGYGGAIPKDKIARIIKYFEMCDYLLHIVENDKELCKLSRDRLGEDDYADKTYRMLTMDIVYFGHQMVKDDSWWPLPEEYKPEINKDQWRSLLDNRELFTLDSLVIMKRLLDIGGEATCTQLSEKYGESPNFYNRGSSSLAQRIYNATGCSLPLRSDGNSKYWPILYTGKYTDRRRGGVYIWRLRDELREALMDYTFPPLSDAPASAVSSGPANFWWLSASPKIWKFSDMGIGEEQAYTLKNENGRKRRIFQNFLDAKAGDPALGYEATPRKQIVALCVISKSNDGEHLYFKKDELLSNPVDYSSLLEYPELQNMEFLKNPNGSLFKLTEDEYGCLMDIIREQNPTGSAKKYENYDKSKFLKEVYIAGENYDSLAGLLREKKNVILQGSPGTGKTFTALRLAYSILGKKDTNRVKFIQFHQSYSYEDFIMGYKPKDNGFSLQTGVFYKFCAQAANNPAEDYFFIIDEINRGNISKIFGEVLVAIENNHRGEAVAMAFGETPFIVPENLYLIGMMNTADRGLAQMDYALRRRFSFFTMVPAFDAPAFIEYQRSFNSEIFDKLIEVIKSLNNAITGDPALGEGCCIGHSYFCNQKHYSDDWLRSIVDYDIIPIIKEYWFEDMQMQESWKQKLLAVFDE